MKIQLRNRASMRCRRSFSGGRQNLGRPRLRGRAGVAGVSSSGHASTGIFQEPSHPDPVFQSRTRLSSGAALYALRPSWLGRAKSRCRRLKGRPEGHFEAQQRPLREGSGCFRLSPACPSTKLRLATTAPSPLAIGFWFSRSNDCGESLTAPGAHPMLDHHPFPQDLPPRFGLVVGAGLLLQAFFGLDADAARSFSLHALRA